MSHAVQMNVRIDADQKKAGDAVFSRYGYTPSGALRRLYRVATSEDDESRELLERLLKDKDSEKQAALLRKERRERNEQFQASLVESLKALGVYRLTEMPSDYESDCALYEEAMEELAKERGWE